MRHSSWLIHAFCMGCLDPTKRPTCPSQHKVHTKSHFLRDSGYFGILWMGKWKWKPKIGWESRQMEDKADVFDLPRKPHPFSSLNSISYATTSMEDTYSLRFSNTFYAGNKDYGLLPPKVTNQSYLCARFLVLLPGVSPQDLEHSDHSDHNPHADLSEVVFSGKVY